VQKVPETPAELNGPEYYQHGSSSDATVCEEIVFTVFLVFREDACIFSLPRTVVRALLRIH
jgi:hypothetical protein